MFNENKKEQVQRGDSVLAFKAGFWYVSSNFVGKALAFITTPIFARMMPVSDYGEFSNFVGWLTILAVFAGAELYNTLSRAYYDFKNNFDDYISSVTFLGCFLTLFLYIVFILFSKVILTIISIPVQYVNLFFITLLSLFCLSMYLSRERTLYSYKAVAIITFLNLFVPTLISFLLVYFLPPDHALSARLYGAYIPLVLIGFFCAASLFRRSRVFNIQYCKYALFISIPLMIHHFTASLLSSTNVMIAKSILGIEYASLVSIAISAVSILIVLFQSISGALTTWLMDNLELNDMKKTSNGVLLYTKLLAFVIAILILFTPELVYILGGEKYLLSIVLIPGLLFGTFVQALTTVFTIILTYDKNVTKTAFFTGIFALISVLAKIWLLPKYGLIVLANVNIVIFIVLFILNYYLVKRAGYADYVNIYKMIIVVLLPGALTFFSQKIYNMNQFRYVLILLILSSLMFYFSRYQKELLNFAKKARQK